MKLHIPVTKVELDTNTKLHGGTPRYAVTLSDGWDTTVTYTSGTQPQVGQQMTVTVEPEQQEEQPS